MHLTDTPIILASQSPRRKELLGLLGVPFSIVPPIVDETPRSREKPEEYVVRIAREKGLEVASRVTPSIVVSADTIVTVDGTILGKPIDETDAIRMLSLLSGRRHFVMTAICIINSIKNETLEGLDTTEVWLDPLTLDQILDYIRRENVMDKAGAYAIQGYASIYIPKIEGNYFNVMGFPLPLVHRLLCRTSS